MGNRKRKREGRHHRNEEWNRERERWASQFNRPDRSQYPRGYEGMSGGPESGEWRQGFRGGYGNSGELSRAAYNRGGVGAGYDPGPNWGNPANGEFGPRGWSNGFEGRGYPTQFGDPGFSGANSDRRYNARQTGFEGGPWGGGRAQEGRWSERGFGKRGFTGGFAGHEYDWSTRGERAHDQEGGWGNGYAEDIAHLRSGPFAGHGPQGYQRPDERLYEEVCERMTENGQLDASRITVRCEQGEVTLEGTVPDRRSKRLAEDIAETARGVRDVHNRLRVSGSEREEKSSPDHHLPDVARRTGFSEAERTPRSRRYRSLE